MKRILLIILSVICLFSCHDIDKKVLHAIYTDETPVWDDVRCTLT